MQSVAGPGQDVVGPGQDAAPAGTRSLEADARIVAKEILNAIAAKDDNYIGSLMPEEVDADPTTLRRYEWDQLRKQMLDAGPKLSEIARDKGIDQVIKVRAGEARLMLYHSEGKTSGQALVLTRTDRGWLLTGSTYMKDLLAPL